MGRAVKVTLSDWSQGQECFASSAKGCVCLSYLCNSKKQAIFKQDPPV